MIIGFAGKAASGKTTAAKRLEKVLEEPTRTIPMAMVLRDEVETFLRRIGAEEFVSLVYGCQEDKIRVFHVDENQALNHCEKWKGFIEDHREIQDRPGMTAVTVRRILQWWGTEYRRMQNPDYWTKAWEKKIHNHALEGGHVFIDDVRFINELNTIKGQGGLIIKIERPGFNGANSHASETSLDGYGDWDGVILNDGTLAQFFSKVEEVTASLMEECPA